MDWKQESIVIKYVIDPIWDRFFSQYFSACITRLLSYLGLWYWPFNKLVILLKFACIASNNWCEYYIQILWRQTKSFLRINFTFKFNWQFYKNGVVLGSDVCRFITDGSNFTWWNYSIGIYTRFPSQCICRFFY